jgi:hypothetical protein
MGDWLLAAEAALWLAAAGVALRVLTFARLAALASGRGGERRARRRPASPGFTPQAEAARIGWAVAAAAGRAPWRALCFERGLAAHFMLRRRGRPSTLYYGARAGEALDAHVWVRLGEADVVGGEEAAAFAILATFPPRAAQP